MPACSAEYVPGRVKEAVEMTEKAIGIAPESEIVRAIQKIVELYWAAQDSKGDATAFDISELGTNIKRTGKMVTVPSRLYGVLEDVFESREANTLSRWLAGAMLIRSLIRDQDLKRSEALIETIR